ncbi:MAG: tRNA (N6-isopentenyl adenosine(37)-C2)-methylthiotransferase MiaB [Gammaproteobacteria bacterium]|nr:tRNA (N6-isopentenyl adenosine(37)-C2)-methylthiotransferase MiaB [Gammaproteobacteria bacterium]
MLKTFYIETWGCQMNVYDSEKMSQLLKNTHQMTAVSNPEDADLLLLNTCSIREKAEEKVFSLLGRWRKLKAASPEKRIGVGGCVASQEGERIFDRAPYVDFVFGPQTLQQLPLFIQRLKDGQSHFLNIDFLPDEKFDQLPTPQTSGVSAFVTIQEGCSKYCKYCIVPFTRGPEVNRKVEDILKEVGMLAIQGVREITLLGQNVNAYRAIDESGRFFDLAALLYHCSKIPGIGRLRFTTSHPVEFTDTLIAAYKDIPELASHLHLPVQSGSNAILQAMGRGHTAQEYLDKIAALKAARPDLTITSDFIIAYPGETEENFMDTLRLVDAVQFDQSFCFIYSPRPGTLAASLECTIPDEEKHARLKRLQAKLDQHSLSHREKLKGTIQRVLVESYDHETQRAKARTEGNVIVHVNDASPRMAGLFIDALIEDVFAHSLRGRFLAIHDPYLDQRMSDHRMSKETNGAQSIEKNLRTSCESNNSCTSHSCSS